MSIAGGEVANFREKRVARNDDISRREDYLMIYLAEQLFGIPVLQIQDVIGNMQVTRVPLAPGEVAGALNLRGRIVTAINVRKRLGLPEYDGTRAPLSVVVEHNGELYSLVIDRVSDVTAIESDLIETNPPTLDAVWRDISNGIVRRDDKLMIILDVSKLLDSVH